MPFVEAVPRERTPVIRPPVADGRDCAVVIAASTHGQVARRAPAKTGDIVYRTIF